MMKYGIFLIVFLRVGDQNSQVKTPEEINCPKHYKAKETDFHQTSPGTWKGTVSGWYYITPTKILAKKGQQLKIEARGKICWQALPWFVSGIESYCERDDQRFVARKKDRFSHCAGPGGAKHAWGLFAAITPIETKNGLYRYLTSSTITVDKDGELVFIIPEGKKGLWEQEYCPYYGDNCGSYDVEVTIVLPTPPHN